MDAEYDAFVKRLARAVYDKRMEGGDPAVRYVPGLRETAQAIGVSTATLSRVECGKVPDSRTLFRLCRWLGPRFNDVWGIVDPK